MLASCNEPSFQIR